MQLIIAGSTIGAMVPNTWAARVTYFLIQLRDAIGFARAIGRPICVPTEPDPIAFEALIKRIRNGAVHHDADARRDRTGADFALIWQNAPGGDLAISVNKASVLRDAHLVAGADAIWTAAFDLRQRMAALLRRKRI